MLAKKWTFEHAKQHFFVYVESNGAEDLLHELRASPIVSHPDVERLASTLYQNLRATALAASAPYYTAMLGAGLGHASSAQRLLEQAAVSKDRAAFLQSAVTVLNGATDFIDASFETLRLIHERNLMPDAFQSLLRQATSMTWAVFETFCFDLFRLLVTTDLRFLRQLTAGQARGKPWDGVAPKLLEWIEAERMKAPSVTHQDAFDAFKIPSMTLRAAHHIYGVLFPSDASLSSLLRAPELAKLSARRHLLMHAAGVVNQAYLEQSGEVLSIGSNLVVTPPELVLAFRAVSSAAVALAQAAAASL